MTAQQRTDAMLAMLRARVKAVSGLPTVRVWQNQKPEPRQPLNTDSFIADAVLTCDTGFRELGDDDEGDRAWRRTEVLYQVSVYVPVLDGEHRALGMAAAIEEAFQLGAPLVVGGLYPVELTEEVRKGGGLRDEVHYAVPVYIAFMFDHP